MRYFLSALRREVRVQVYVAAGYAAALGLLYAFTSSAPEVSCCSALLGDDIGPDGAPPGS